MEKQQAIDFIVSEMGKGSSQDEIVSQLSRQLGAPEEIVRSFVERTIASQAAQPTAPPPPMMEIPEEEAQPSDIEEVLEESEQADAFEDFTDLADTGSDIMGQDEPDLEALPEAQAFPVEQSEWVEEIQLDEEMAPVDQDLPLGEDQPMEEIHAEAAAAEFAESPAEEVQAAPAWEPQPQAMMTAEALSPGDRARLEKAILAALAKQQRQSDVVMMVCERTGMSWNQAQRLVADVNMKNRSKMNKRQGTIQILLSLVALLAGLALVFLVLSEAYTYYRLYAQPEAVGSAMLPVLDRFTLWGGVVGILLFLGGITGIVLGIRKRQD